MSEFKEEHKISMLTGSPPGYVGYGEGGVLTEAVRRKPFSLLLLDEMEKAHPGIQDVFYQVFDKGNMKDGQGRDINFKHSMIVMTSNVCSKTINDYCQDPDSQPEVEDLLEALQEELQKTFKPAFLGRVTVIPYLPLQPKVMEKIVQLKLKSVQDRVQQAYKIKLKWNKSTVNHLLKKCQQPELGARQIDNLINAEILPSIAALFFDYLTGQSTTLKEITIKEDSKGKLRYIKKST